MPHKDKEITYTVDLTKPYDLHLGLDYLVGQKKRLPFPEGVIDFLKIRVISQLAGTTSKKVEVGRDVLIDVFGAQQTENREQIGTVALKNNCLSFFLILPNRVFDHLVRSLTHGESKTLKIMGRELRRNESQATGISIGP